MSKEAADAAKSSADATLKSADASQHTVALMRLDQRAWLSIESVQPVPLSPTVGQTFTIKVKIKNTGKTPARKVVVNVVAERVSKDQQPNYAYGDDEKVVAGLLPPDNDYTATVCPAKSASTGQPAALTPQVVAAMSAGDVRIFVHGRLTYEDIFGTPHWLDFCSFLITPFNGHFGAHDEHNDTDDYTPAPAQA